MFQAVFTRGVEDNDLLVDPVTPALKPHGITWGTGVLWGMIVRGGAHTQCLSRTRTPKRILHVLPITSTFAANTDYQYTTAPNSELRHAGLPLRRARSVNAGTLPDCFLAHHGHAAAQCSAPVTANAIRLITASDGRRADGTGLKPPAW